MQKKKKKKIYSTPIIVFTYYFGHTIFASFYFELFQCFHDILYMPTLEVGIQSGHLPSLLMAIFFL